MARLHDLSIKYFGALVIGKVKIDLKQTILSGGFYGGSHRERNIAYGGIVHV